MDTPPAFQFYADDFLAGTMKFSDAETGLYIRLLCAQWSEGSLPDDDGELSSYGRGDTHLARVKAKFVRGPDGRLRNGRLEKVRAKQIEHRQERSDSGKLGAEKRWHSHSTANGSAMPQPMAKNGSPSPSPSPLKDSKLSKAHAEIRERFKIALGNQWENDAGKWVNRIKAQPGKCGRVIAEVESAIKERRIDATPAAYAENCWQTFADD